MTSIFNIDRSALDEEWAGQSELFYGCAEQLAHARKEYEFKKSQVDLIRAQTALSIRRDPRPPGIPRLTDKIIEQLVAIDPKVRRAGRMAAEARHAVDILQAAVTALEHRKRALEGLVSLHGQSYFSTPRVKQKTDFADTIEKRAVRRKGIRKKKEEAP